MIQVVERTFDILELLAKENTPLSNTSIALKMGISIQTAGNLLRTLYARGYVSQDESRNYRLGAQCLYLGSFADRWAVMRKRLSEPLRQLVTESSFNGFIGVIDNDKLLSIAVQNQNENFLTIPKQHWWNELHATACGRVLLASLSTTERDKLFARTSRQKLTTKTVIDSEELERICNQVATDGYSEVQDESRQGISSLAVPLRDLTGTVFAGMAISATNDKWQTIPLQRKLKFLSDAIERL